MATRKADRPLQRNIESARPASFATVESYTTIRDTTLDLTPLASALARLEEGYARYLTDTSDQQIRDGLV